MADPVPAIFDQHSGPARDLARWSARLFAATFLLTGLPRSSGAGRGLAGSLAGRLQDAVWCLAQAPRWLPAVLLLISFWPLRRALWWALGEYLAAEDDPATLAPRGLAVDRWRAPGFRATRRRLLARAVAVIVLACLSGVASVALAGRLLDGRALSLSLVGLVLLAAALLSRLETLPFARPGGRIQPPDPGEVKSRLAGYLARFPQETGTGSALLYAYSRLERRELTRRVAALAGPWGRPAGLAAAVLTAVLFSLAPAPAVDRLVADGLAGCSYATVFGLAEVAGQNLPLCLLIVVLLVALSPLPVIWSFLRFMAEWRFPLAVRAEVLRRERRPALRNAGSAALSCLVRAVAATAALWLSATVGSATASPLAGLVALFLAGALAAYPAQRLTRRGP